jgi:hypothetical protein
MQELQEFPVEGFTIEVFIFNQDKIAEQLAS